VYRFLISRRWLAWFALVTALAAACAVLGMWQLERRNAVVSDIGRIEANYEQSPVPYEEATADFATYDPLREWTPVKLTGEYDTAGQVVVRNRPMNGQPGYEVLTPLRLADGTAVIIDRGWLPIGNDNPGRPDSVPAPPEGTVTVTARIKPGEPAVNRGAPEGQIASIDLKGYAAQLGYPVQTGAYGLMAAEDPAPAAGAPAQFPKPSLNEGPHLSYSLQWFAFGVLLFVGLGYAARQQARLDREEAGGRPEATKRPGRRPTAEEAEDALLDAQGYR
jgi:cytochrome oxidase assembly protein ShyY1